MDTIQVGIESLSRDSSSEPWKMTFLTPVDGIRMTAILGSGNVEVGPRLREVLTSIERYQTYPRTITGKELELLGMATRDSFTIKFLANMPVHIEIGFKPFRQFKKPTAPKVSGATTEVSWTAEELLSSEDVEIQSLFSINALPKAGADFNQAVKTTSYLVVGREVRIKDGDTISIVVEKAGPIAEKDRRISEGATIDIRFAGLNTPETKEHGVEQGKERNKEYIEKYGIKNDEEAFAIGQEAMDFVENFINNSGYIVVDLDAYLDGTVKADTYGRFLGAIYQTTFTTPDEPLQAGFTAPQLNKSLLGTMSKTNKKAPLAMPYEYFINNEYSRLSPVDWLYDLGIRERSDDKLGERIKEEKSKKQETTNPLQDGTTLEVKTTKDNNNQIDFMEAYDDRIDSGEIFKDGIDHQCRIGDVMLVVPPLSIDVNRTTNITKVKTLRSKSSMMIKGGSAHTTLTLQLYFHDLDSINGYPTKMHPDKDRLYYMDGLRPLIAQFKKAPFVPIDNKYINETLGIDSVALVNLSVQTVPGFPHSIAASLTLVKFDHEAYMPQWPRLSDGINYPMLRWYYQEPLRTDVEQSEHRTWLTPIPNEGLTNDFSFFIAEEEELIARKDAIRNLRNLTNPLIMEERFSDPTTSLTSGGDGSDIYTELGRLYKDGVAAQRVIDMRSRYLKAKKEGRVPTQRDENGMTPVKYRISDKSNVVKESKKLFYEIYGDDKTDDIMLGRSNFAPFESYIHNWQTQSYDLEEEYKKWPESTGGSIKIRLLSKTNIDLFPEDRYKRVKDEDELTAILIPATDIDLVSKILERGKQAEDRYLDAIKEWDETKAAVQATEGTLNLRKFSVNGELIPINVTVMYENQFSTAQLQMLDGPSFQFLGGQDPYIQVMFEADEFAVQDIRFMLEEVERFSREYRTGITSGFLGVENHLMALFGVKTVMPENVQIRTVPGFPGRYQIEMTLVGFNKTQKRTEALEGISPIYGDTVDLNSRKAGILEDGADEAVIFYKMQNLELYPDLELPKYNELIDALPYINAKCNVYENRTGGIYLDPDFYMATPQTIREYVREQSVLNQELQIKDFMGVEMTTGSTYGSPLQGDQSMWDILNSVDARTEQVSSTFSWSGEVTDSKSSKSKNAKVTYANKEIEAYIKDRNSLLNPPSFKEWKEMGLGTDERAYIQWKNKSPEAAKQGKVINPKEWEVYNKIYELVDKYWVADGLVFNDKGTKYTNKAWQKVTYASNEDLSDANWNHLVSKNPDLLKDGQSKTHKLDELTQKEYKSTGNKPTREFIANIIKAIFHVRSKWKQTYSSGMPMLDAAGNAAGIGGVPISSEATDLLTAKKLLWDWEYNMEVAVKHLYESYKAAYNHAELKFKYHPWDWMISAYATGTIDMKVVEMENSFWQQVHSVHSAHYRGIEKMYATPTASVSLVLMQQRNGYDSHVMGVINGNKEDLIEELMATGYRKGKKNKADTKAWLEKQNPAEVQNVYKAWMFDLYEEMSGYVRDYDTQDVYSVNPYVGLVKLPDMEIAGSDLGDIMQDRIANGDRHAEIYFQYLEASNYIENEVYSRLVNSALPEDIFPEMFTDIIQYDQRMRLLRAFPTFQMFIVDEGRWMTNYRLWDNLYGFNAIQSIDIHKSRKIAADTAVITMTNIYSNLTNRSLDTSYEEWDYKFWDNLVFGNPNEKLLEARKELLNSLLLQTGARIHLRMGYGSSANDLPVVFNGTITEMSAEDIVQIVAQGDGIELGNVISGDPSDDNKSFFKVTEPRDLICKLLTSKGNWFKDVINDVSDGSLFKDNPLGIMHFGQPGAQVPEGTWKFFNSNYGEAAQNIYSSNGMNTFSQWAMQDGSGIKWSWDTPVTDWLQPGDEDNVVIPFYNNTTWDVAQTLAYTSLDYIAAVHPFEMRSTLFFGKPYWRLAYTYDSNYEYDESQQAWVRYRNLEHRKPYAQVHMFDSTMDIIDNKIKASEDGVYTNVIVNYDGQQTPVMYADFDIRFDKQKTTVIDAQISARMPGIDFFTSEKQAMYYGISAVRDYMKDMYKGELVVLGDPTIKPHDICYMNDEMRDMNGNFQVKAVTHHFSQETGFISSIQPDVMAVSDDMALMTLNNWIGAMGAKFAAHIVAMKLSSRVVRRLIPSSLAAKVLKMGGKGATSVTQVSLAKLANFLPDDDPDVSAFKKDLKELRDIKLDDPARPAKLESLEKNAKAIEKNLAKWEQNGKFKVDGIDIKGKGSYARMKRTVKAVKSATSALKDGKNAFKLIRMAGTALSVANPLTLVAAAVSTWAVEGIVEKYRRKKASMQCVLIMPLMYQGRQYTAGINGHKGMVVGDAMGKIDSFLSGMGFDGINGNSDWEWLMDTWNWYAESGVNQKQFSVSEEDLRSGKNKE